MATAGDKQENQIQDAADVISQQRAAVQQAAQRIAQAQTVLGDLPNKHSEAINDATGSYAERWDELTQAYQNLKPLVDAAVNASEVQALKDLDV